MRRAHAAVAVAVSILAVVVAAAGCGGDEEEEPVATAGDLAGSWDISLVVGSVEADPAAEPGEQPGDATFREHWVFEACDDTGCRLRRPDGGVLLGDLDDVRVELGRDEGLAEGDDQRFIGEGEGRDPLPLEDPTPCDGGPTERWSVRVEVGVRDGVLSGSVIRHPEALRADAGGIPCFGFDLTLGFSGIPRAGVATTQDG